LVQGKTSGQARRKGKGHQKTKICGKTEKKGTSLKKGAVRNMQKRRIGRGVKRGGSNISLNGVPSWNGGERTAHVYTGRVGEGKVLKLDQTEAEGAL